MSMEVVDVAVVYHGASDLAWPYGVRVHRTFMHEHSMSTGPCAQPLALVTSLDAARAAIRLLRPDLAANIGRDPQDDPVIAEVWV